MREPFDDELRERLQQYTEEPEKDLWAGITSRVHPVRIEPIWTKGTQYFSLVAVGLAIYFYQTGMPADGSSVSQAMILPSQSQTAPRTNDSLKISMNANNPTGVSIVGNTLQEKEVNELKGESVSAPVVENKVEGTTEDKVEDHLISFNSQPIVGSSEAGPDELTLENDTIVGVQKTHNSDTLTKAALPKETDQRTKIRGNGFTAYFMAMPTMGYQRIESNQTDNIIIESIDRIPAFSSQRIGFRLELGLQFPVSRKLTVFGGLVYFQSKQTIGYTQRIPDSTTVASGPNGEITIEPHFSHVQKSFDYELRNVGFQVGLLYKLTSEKPRTLTVNEALTSETMSAKRKFIHQIGAGIEFQKGLNQSTNPGGITNPSAYVFSNLFYRIQYPSEGRLRAIFQPTLNYSFYVNENSNAPFYVKPFGFGLNLGCTYNF